MAHDHCEGQNHDECTVSRRGFFRRSLGTLLGLTVGAPMLGMISGQEHLAGLSSLWAGDPNGAPERVLRSRIRSVILLWMDGGPSQLDTFDPKPGHANGGPFKAIKTAQHGVQFSEHLPRMAELADRMCVIRSMSTAEGNHSRARHLLKTGYIPQGTVRFPGMGAMTARSLHGGDLSIPANVAINAPGWSSGFLGVRYDPFFVSDPTKPVANLALPRMVDDERFDRRMALLQEMQQSFDARIGGDSPEVERFSKITESAREFMRSDGAGAFDLSGESAAALAAYGDSRFGKGCLMARRLVETGVMFVEVTLNGWDTHDDNFTRVGNLLGVLDPAVTALLRDLEERKLLDSTLVLCMGEFGRTPRINGREGRDHFPRAWSAVLAGGGVRPGVIGSTAEDGTSVVDRPVTSPDLFRTIYALAGIDPDREFQTPEGRSIKAVNGGTVITEAMKAEG